MFQTTNLKSKSPQHKQQLQKPVKTCSIFSGFLQPGSSAMLPGRAQALPGLTSVHKAWRRSASSNSKHNCIHQVGQKHAANSQTNKFNTKHVQQPVKKLLIKPNAHPISNIYLLSNLHARIAWLTCCLSPKGIEISYIEGKSSWPQVVRIHLL